MGIASDKPTNAHTNVSGHIKLINRAHSTPCTAAGCWTILPSYTSCGSVCRQTASLYRLMPSLYSDKNMYSNNKQHTPTDHHLLESSELATVWQLPTGRVNVYGSIRRYQYNSIRRHIFLTMWNLYFSHAKLMLFKRHVSLLS